MSTKADCITALQYAYGDRQYRNWDGKDAIPLQYKTLQYCIAIVQALPDGCVLPTPTVVTAGNLGLQWSLLNRQVLLSVDVYGMCNWYVMWWGHTLPVMGTFIFDGEISTILLPYIREDILAND